MEKISKDGISYILRMVPTSMAPIFIFLISIGNCNYLFGWIYFGLFFLLNIFNIIFILIKNPSLLNERGKTKADIKKEDNIFVMLHLLFSHILISLCSGLEIRIFQTDYVNVYLVTIGIFLMILSGFIENYAMLANNHFERNIRIQNDRNHIVISGGPYKIIRHPGYLSYIIRILAFPLIVPSFIGIFIAILGVIVLINRTIFEDDVLNKELVGYNEYSHIVKYRLIPFIW